MYGPCCPCLAQYNQNVIKAAGMGSGLNSTSRFNHQFYEKSLNELRLDSEVIVNVVVYCRSMN